MACHDGILFFPLSECMAKLGRRVVVRTKDGCTEAIREAVSGVLSKRSCFVGCREIPVAGIVCEGVKMRGVRDGYCKRMPVEKPGRPCDGFLGCGVRI